jgi:hypothetical protein
MKGPFLKTKLPFFPRPQPDVLPGPAPIIPARPMFGPGRLKLWVANPPAPSHPDAQALAFVVPSQPMYFGRRLGGAGIISRQSIGVVVPARLSISGITKDSTGAVLGSCVVALFRTVANVFVESTTSDPVTGAYAFSTVGSGQAYYVVAYKPGSPDVAGTTVNTLAGV